MSSSRYVDTHFYPGSYHGSYHGGGECCHSVCAENYSPTRTYTPPIGRLPVLGKVRAEIDKIRSDIYVANNNVENQRVLTTATLKKEGAAIGKIIQETRLVREEAQKSNADAVAATANVSLVSANIAKTVAEKELTRYNISKTLYETKQIQAASNKLMVDAVKTKADTELSMVSAAKTATELPQVKAETLRITRDTGRIDAATHKLNVESTSLEQTTTNDTNKTNAEVSRLGAETTRINTETTKISKETDKVETEIIKIGSETNLLRQKTATEAAQTGDYISPDINAFTQGSVLGLMGKQKYLFEKQAAGFDRDAEQKLAKIMVDTWTVRQTTDGGQPVDANNLSDAHIAAVINKAKQGIGA